MKTKILYLLAAVIVAFSCTNDDANKPSTEELYINNLMTQCKNFDSQILIHNLPGEWITDSVYGYDEDWQNVKNVMVYKGDHRWDGGGNYTYTYAADGMGNCYVQTIGPGDNTSYSFSWQYNAENQELVLNGEWNARWTVSGFNNKYLIIDYTSTSGNCREVYKRKAE